MTDLDDPVPVNFANPGCPAMVRRPVGQWQSCDVEPVLAGFRDITEHVAPARRGRYRLFVCSTHRDLVEGAAPMSDEDRAELAGRIVQEELALSGKRWMRPGPVEDYDQPGSGQE